MGIHIYMAISKSVTKEEWESVYEETLQLVKHLPFMERDTIKIHNIDTRCLVRTEERLHTFGTFNRVIGVGWMTEGDYSTMSSGEDYYMPRDLVGDNMVDIDAGDAMMRALTAYMSFDKKDERFRKTYDIWGMKTQGEPYHIFLLAVAALIENRLGSKAFTYGDITKRQFEKAVELGNRYLSNPIEMPDRCNIERMMNRVLNLPLTESEKLQVFDCFYLGPHDDQFEQYIRQSFDDAVIDDYLEHGLKSNSAGIWGFIERKNSAALLEKEYDIYEYDELMFYEKGNTIHPTIEKSIACLMKKIDETIEEGRLKILLQRDTAACYKWLQEVNRFILIRDKDWERVYANMEQDIKSFERYYGLMKIDTRDDDIYFMCIAIMINDELYDYSGGLKYD